MSDLPIDPPVDPALFGLNKVAYSPREVMELLGVSRARLYHSVSAGELKVCHFGSRSLILAGDLAQFLLTLRAKGIPSRKRTRTEPGFNAMGAQIEGAPE